MTAPKTIHEWKRAKLIRALRRAEGNRGDAAKLLGVSVRTVRYWLHQFDLKDEFPPPGPAEVTAVDEYMSGKRGANDHDE